MASRLRRWRPEGGSRTAERGDVADPGERSRRRMPLVRAAPREEVRPRGSPGSGEIRNSPRLDRWRSIEAVFPSDVEEGTPQPCPGFFVVRKFGFVDVSSRRRHAIFARRPAAPHASIPPGRPFETHTSVAGSRASATRVLFSPREKVPAGRMRGRGPSSHRGGRGRSPFAAPSPPLPALRAAFPREGGRKIGAPDGPGIATASNDRPSEPETRLADGGSGR